MRVVAILALLMLAGCATYDNGVAKKEDSQIDKYMKAKQRGDVYVCHGRHRNTATCGYMNQDVLRQKLEHAGIF